MVLMRYRAIVKGIEVLMRNTKPTYNKHRGAMSELAASAWLMEQGYEVFRNVSHYGKYDLILRDVDSNEFTPVDVTTGTINYRKDGTESISWPRKADDVLTLVVLKDGRFLWALENDLI